MIAELNRLIERHQNEDEDRAANAAKFRKFRWALLAMIITIIIGILVEIYFK